MFMLILIIDHQYCGAWLFCLEPEPTFLILTFYSPKASEATKKYRAKSRSWRQSPKRFQKPKGVSKARSRSRPKKGPAPQHCWSYFHRGKLRFSKKGGGRGEGYTIFFLMKNINPWILVKQFHWPLTRKLTTSCNKDSSLYMYVYIYMYNVQLVWSNNLFWDLIIHLV